MGLVAVDGQACWRGSTVAVVILGLFLFLNLGGCGLMGVGRFFILSCFLNCFTLQTFKRITSPHPHRHRCD